MRKRGLVTQEESNTLTTIPPKARYNAVFSWIMTTITRGCEEPDPSVRMPANAHFAFLLRMTDLRNSCATITDLVDARCPLAYVHLVQLLVDSFLLITPFAALGNMGWFSVAATFLLSLFFSGLMDLAKMLYDPLDNEVFGDIDNIQIDTVIQEINNGSLRFAATGSLLPGGERKSSDMVVPEFNFAT
jgi:predicted membrane chloride channel (bestrophin family)